MFRSLASRSGVWAVGGTAWAVTRAHATLGQQLRWASTGAGANDEVRPPLHPPQPSPPSSEELAAAVAATDAPKVREHMYKSYAARKGVSDSPKAEKLVEMWRNQPNGEGGTDVAQMFGSTFRDTRPVDPNETIEDKRRRLIYQSRYRGMVEMDLIFGHFARCKLEALEAELLPEYDTLLKQYDNDLFQWLVMGLPAPEEIAAMRCFGVVKRFVENERSELLGHY